LKQGNQTFYDILYIDEKRLNSIYSQVNWGLYSNRTETESKGKDKIVQNQVTGEGNAAIVSGGFQVSETRTTNDSLQYTKNFVSHHERILELIGLLGLDLDDPMTKIPARPDGRINVLKGKLSLSNTASARENLAMLKLFVEKMHDNQSIKMDIKKFFSDNFTVKNFVDMVDILMSFPSAIQMKLELDNKVISGVLNPEGLFSSHENSAFFMGNNLPLEWTVVGYCYPKEITVNDGWSAIIEPFRSAIEELINGRVDIRMTPLLILR
jgi:hypothetical protein